MHSIPLTIPKPIFQNAGAFYLQPGGILIIKVQAPTELKPRYIYELSTINNLQSKLIPLAVDHKINPKYPNLLNIPIHNMAQQNLHPKISNLQNT